MNWGRTFTLYIILDEIETIKIEIVIRVMMMVGIIKNIVGNWDVGEEGLVGKCGGMDKAGQWFLHSVEWWMDRAYFNLSNDGGSDLAF